MTDKEASPTEEELRYIWKVDLDEQEKRDLARKHLKRLSGQIGLRHQVP